MWKTLWPNVTFYDKQKEVIKATCEYPEVYVPAGNELGKDFVAGFIALGSWIICAADNVTCRIVTTSVAEHHLKVLWGEIGRFLVTATRPLLVPDGGPFVVNYQEVRRQSEAAAKNPLNYLVGRVSAKGEGLAGHHAEYTLLIGDESSGLDDTVYEMGQGWADRMLFLGNPNDTHNWWRKAIDELDRDTSTKPAVA